MAVNPNHHWPFPNKRLDYALGFSDRTVRDWAAKLLDESRFDRERNAYLAKALKLFGDQSTATIATKWTGDAEGYTPAGYIESARTAMGSIDVDPASNPQAQRVVRARVYYTRETNGLDKDWVGNVFLNPLYRQPDIQQFIDKLLLELDRGNASQAVLLTNNNTDTRWFHEAVHVAQAICFTKGRIQFYKPDESTTQPTNGQCFFYFGHDPQPFITRFKDFGTVYPPPY